MSKQPTYSPVVANVLRVVVYGTWFVIAAIAILLAVTFYLTPSPHVLGSLAVCGIAGVYVTTAYMLSQRHHYHPAAYLLILFYLLLASGIVWSWGINTPIAPLFFGVVIVLAGILLTARHALITGMLAAVILLIIQATATFGWHQADTSWVSNESSFGDVLGYSTLFGMLALVSWLYNREMERALAHAKRAEAALRQQKATLKRQVQERTKDLQRLQLEEMRQMYRFANLGQLGVTLLHDLANHVTALTLEIEGMEDKQHPAEIARAQKITQYISNLVKSTRQRLHGGTQKQSFNIVRKTDDTVDFLRYKAAQKNVHIDWQPPASSWQYTGDPESFCQIVSILISNAIDAYSKAPLSDERRVVVTMQATSKHIFIRVSDWGKGITKNQRKQLFKPHHSTKKSGLGLGLYIAKQTAEMLFSGTITLGLGRARTEFIVKLPLKHDK